MLNDFLYLNVELEHPSLELIDVNTTQMKLVYINSI